MTDTDSGTELRKIHRSAFFVALTTAMFLGAALLAIVQTVFPYQPKSTAGQPPLAGDAFMRAATKLRARRSLERAAVVWAGDERYCYVDFNLEGRYGSFKVPDDWCAGMR
jgi:hypothetical protein